MRIHTSASPSMVITATTRWPRSWSEGRIHSRNIFEHFNTFIRSKKAIDAETSFAAEARQSALGRCSTLLYVTACNFCNFSDFDLKFLEHIFETYIYTIRQKNRFFFPTRWESALTQILTREIDFSRCIHLHCIHSRLISRQINVYIVSGLSRLPYTRSNEL